MKRLIILSSFLLIACLSYSQVSVVAYDTEAGDPYGPELITNGDFDTDLTGWTQFSATEYTWESDGSGGGRARKTPGTAIIIFQLPPLTVGKTYHIIYTVDDRTAGKTYARCGLNLGPDNLANGTFIVDLECTTNGNAVIGCDAAFDGWIDIISFKEVL